MSQTPTDSSVDESQVSVTPVDSETSGSAASSKVDTDNSEDEIGDSEDEAGEIDDAVSQKSKPRLGSPDAERKPEPYDFAQCSVTLAVRLLPELPNTDGRRVVVTVISHDDPPLVRAGCLNLETLPPFLHTALLDFIAELPQRKLAQQERNRKQQAKEDKRKAAAAPTTKRKKRDLSAVPEQIGLVSSPLTAVAPAPQPTRPAQAPPATKSVRQQNSTAPLTSAPLIPTADEESVQALLFD